MLQHIPPLCENRHRPMNIFFSLHKRKTYRKKKKKKKKTDIFSIFKYFREIHLLIKFSSHIWQLLNYLLSQTKNNFIFFTPEYLNCINMLYLTTSFCIAAAKLHQSCPTLCNPTESSPPGSSVPGILLARILEWVSISFSSELK